MRIHLVTPAPPGSLHGNRFTALRWQGHLRALGHEVTIDERWSGEDADLMVALHATRSHATITAVRERCPGLPLVLILTGTDLYRDLCAPGDARDRALASIARADRLVVLQEEALAVVPTSERAKAVTIHQSVPPISRQPRPRRSFLVTVIGHLRHEKDPLCIVDALRHVPRSHPLRVVHLGKAMDPELGARARQAMRDDARYRWLGERLHHDTMRWLARSHVMVISSRMEGGAHVVSEALSAGVPVLATEIPGNRGLLGTAYPGYFPVGDTAALAALLVRAQTDRGFLEELTAAVCARRSMVLPATERQRIARLLEDLRWLSDDPERHLP